ncbi:hypothetical protein [Arboricoccus pini]|nr:hypothetical protein [Arboricoccus pini]
MGSKLGCGIALAAILSVGAGPAWAQSKSIQTDIFQNGAQGGGIPGVTVPHTAPPKSQPAPQPSKKAPAKTAKAPAPVKGGGGIAVTYDKKLSQDIQEQFLAKIKAQNPQGAEEVRQQLQQRSAEERFADDLKAYGFSINDLSDVATAHMILMWMIANKSDAPSAQAAQAVRGQIRNSLAQDPSLKKATARDRQIKAENIIYDALMRISAFNQIRRAGDDAAVQKFSDQTQADFKKTQQLDLRALKLSNRGFTMAGKG